VRAARRGTRCESRFLQAVKQTGPRSVRLRKGRSFNRTSSSRIAWLSSGKLKNFRFRNATTIQRSTTCTPLSAFALSRGLYGRAARLPSVMHRELLIGGIQIRIVTAGSGDGGLGVIGTVKSVLRQETPARGCAPGSRLPVLITSRFRLGVGTGASTETNNDAGQACPSWRHPRDRCPRPVHEHLFPGFVFLRSTTSRCRRHCR